MVTNYAPKDILVILFGMLFIRSNRKIPKDVYQQYYQAPTEEKIIILSQMAVYMFKICGAHFHQVLLEQCAMIYFASAYAE